MELLEFKHIYKEFDGNQILKDINLKIPRGKIIGLLRKKWNRQNNTNKISK